MLARDIALDQGHQNKKQSIDKVSWEAYQGQEGS